MLQSYKKVKKEKKPTFYSVYKGVIGDWPMKNKRALSFFCNYSKSKYPRSFYSISVYYIWSNKCTCFEIPTASIQYPLLFFIDKEHIQN